MFEEIKAELQKMTTAYESAAQILEEVDENQVMEALRGFEKLRGLNQQMSKKLTQYIKTHESMEDTPFVFNIAMLTEEISKMNAAALKVAKALQERFAIATSELEKASALHQAQVDQLESIQKLMDEEVRGRKPN